MFRATPVPPLVTMIVPPAGPKAVGKVTTSPASAFRMVTATDGVIWKAGVKVTASPVAGQAMLPTSTRRSGMEMDQAKSVTTGDKVTPP